MLLKSGDVLLVDIPPQESDNFSGKRPVVVLENIDDDKMKVIPISSNTRTGNTDRITISLLLNDRVSYISLLCDHVMILSKALIKTQIGKVSSDVMIKIRQLTDNALPLKRTVESFDKSVGITIFDNKFDELLGYIKNTNSKANILTSKKTFIINIFVAIMTGIAASLITNIIWFLLG